MGLPPESPEEERRWNFEFGAKLEAFLLLEFQLCIAWLSFRVQCLLIRFCDIT